jgi:hypothetical protein
MKDVSRRLLAILLAIPLFGAGHYLFTSFRRNGETGIFLAASSDGRAWTPLNGNRPWMKPEQPGMLMRDPWLGQGHDGTCVARIGDEWWIYFDHYGRPRHYGAVRTRDRRSFEDASGDITFPANNRHGTVVRISDDLARRLERTVLPNP